MTTDSQSEGAWTPDRVQAALRQILARAGADPAFRQLCLVDPRAAVQQETRQELPEKFSLRFVDNAHADLTIVLPDPISSAELSDQDLEAVSGGIKCLVGSCGATEVCGITDPCLASKAEGTADERKKSK